MQQKVSLAEKLSTFSDHYGLRTVAEFNGYDVMVVKLLGPFRWHSHPETPLAAARRTSCLQWPTR